MDVLLAAAVGLVLLGLVVVAAVLGTRTYDARRPPRAVGQGGAPDSSGASLADRVASLEREFPAWRMAMSDLADQCEEVLDRAEKKRRSARMAQQRAEGEDEQQPQQQGFQLPADPNEARAFILAHARAKRAGRI